jgi:hypothetical protein
LPPKNYLALRSDEGPLFDSNLVVYFCVTTTNLLSCIAVVCSNPDVHARRAGCELESFATAIMIPMLPSTFRLKTKSLHPPAQPPFLIRYQQLENNVNH